MRRALKSGKFPAGKIYVNETGVSTVIQAPNVTKLRACKMGQAAPGKRGTMITICMIINAVGNTIPSAFVFPRAKFYDSMPFGAPPGIEF